MPHLLWRGWRIERYNVGKTSSIPSLLCPLLGVSSLPLRAFSIIVPMTAAAFALALKKSKNPALTLFGVVLYYLQATYGGQFLRQQNGSLGLNSGHLLKLLKSHFFALKPDMPVIICKPGIPASGFRRQGNLPGPLQIGNQGCQPFHRPLLRPYMRLYCEPSSLHASILRTFRSNFMLVISRNSKASP